MAQKFINQRQFQIADYSISQDDKLQTIANDVHKNPETWSVWPPLLEAVENQEGGLGRNSTPEAIKLYRETFDELLARFPLYFGFWRKYAGTEFTIGATETAEMIYERGIAACPHVLGMWDGYITFKLDVCHDDEQIRELFERCVEDVGLDFQAADIWDKYLAFEAQNNSDKTRYYSILLRLVKLPIRAHDKYATALLNMAQSMPTEEMTTSEHHASVLNNIQQEASRNSAIKVDATVRDVITTHLRHTIEATKQEVQKRIGYEDALAQTQNYFLPMKRTEPDIKLWVDYLDFEEVNGNYETTKMLYERALVVLAYHEELWSRYARWMLAQQGHKEQEVRNIFQRASQIFVPIGQPQIRMHYAFFEETQGNIDYALAIIKAVLDQLPDDFETILAHVNIVRRQLGVDAAIEVCEEHIKNPACLSDTKGSVLVEAARLLANVKGNIFEARRIFESNKNDYAACGAFWDGYVLFELDRVPSSSESRNYERVKAVFDDILHRTEISPEFVTSQFEKYFEYLQDYGTKDTMKEYLKVDALIKGSKTVQVAMNAEIADEAAKGNGKQRQITGSTTGDQNGGHESGGAYASTQKKRAKGRKSKKGVSMHPRHT